MDPTLESMPHTTNVALGGGLPLDNKRRNNYTNTLVQYCTKHHYHVRNRKDFLHANYTE